LNETISPRSAQEGEANPKPPPRLGVPPQAATDGRTTYSDRKTVARKQVATSPTSTTGVGVLNLSGEVPVRHCKALLMGLPQSGTSLVCILFVSLFSFFLFFFLNSLITLSKLPVALYSLRR
jgi:hypothetical protein